MDSPDAVPILTPIACLVLQKRINLTVVDYMQFLWFDSDDPNPRMEVWALWMEQEGPEYWDWNMQGIKDTAQTFGVNLNSLRGYYNQSKVGEQHGPGSRSLLPPPGTSQVASTQVDLLGTFTQPESAGLSANLIFSSVQSLSPVRLFVTPWTATRQASLSITNSWSLLKLMSIESVLPSNHLILCHPFLILPSFFSSIKVFSNELVLCIR